MPTNLFVTNPKYSDMRAFDSQVKELFGLNPKAKWPPEGMPARTIQGITCWVLPAFPAQYMRPRWGGEEKKVKSSQHRTMSQCPACDRIIPLGRLKQHSKVHSS